MVVVLGAAESDSDSGGGGGDHRYHSSAGGGWWRGKSYKLHEVEQSFNLQWLLFLWIYIFFYLELVALRRPWAALGFLAPSQTSFFHLWMLPPSVDLQVLHWQLECVHSDLYMDGDTRRRGGGGAILRYHDARSFIGEYIKFNRKNHTKSLYI